MFYMNITNSILYVGVNDYKTDLFEGQYRVPNGISYNSYIIDDEKIAVLDTVDASFGEQWLSNIDSVLNGKTPDYLVIHHMEPDHSANIDVFAKKYPNAVIVSSQKAFAMMSGFFGCDYADRRIVVGEGDKLNLGKHTLNFIAAPMVHWPEVIMSYEQTEQVLFSADGFGKFGALDCIEPWESEARRYYIGIVGKYGTPVTAVLKKAASLDIKKICPLHGPILDHNLPYYLGLYTKWASYEAESNGVVIAYASVYGNTADAAKLLANTLSQSGKEVALYDLARCDIHAAIADAFRYKNLVLASCTYNGTVFPCMREYIASLVDRNYSSRNVALIENGSWAPMAAKVMHNMLEPAKNLTFAQTQVKITSSLNDSSRTAINDLANEILTF